MSGHVVEQLPDWLNGALPPEEAAAVEDHLDTCPTCNEVLASHEEVLGALALTLEPVQPDPSVRARLLATVATGRLHHLAGRVSALFFGMAEDDARAALDALDEPGAWEPSPLPGIAQRRLRGAPKGWAMGFIRIPPGARMPLHEHLGGERTLVLQGRLHDSEGGVYLPGQEMPKTRGTRHTFVNHGPADLVCAVVSEGGVTFV